MSRPIMPVTPLGIEECMCPSRPKGRTEAARSPHRLRDRRTGCIDGGRGLGRWYFAADLVGSLAFALGSQPTGPNARHGGRCSPVVQDHVHCDRAKRSAGHPDAKVSQEASRRRPHSLHCLRNLVERCFNKLKNARRVATRYDKTAESFLGFIDITSIRLWLRHLST